jgi:hypothetical protein
MVWPSGVNANGPSWAGVETTPRANSAEEGTAGPDSSNAAASNSKKARLIFALYGSSAAAIVNFG